VTGATWSLPGDEAVLFLRTVIANGDFTQYWQHHTRCDYQRIHSAPYQENSPLPHAIRDFLAQGETHPTGYALPCGKIT